MCIRDRLRRVIKIQSGDEPYDEGVMAITKSLSKIRYSLEFLVAKSGIEREAPARFNNVQIALIEETRLGIAVFNKALLEYIESQFDPHKLEPLQDHLALLSSNLTNLQLKRAASILSVADYYFRSKLLRDEPQHLSSQMENFADVLLSIDYFLSRLLKNADDSSLKLLALGESAAKKLRIDSLQETDSSAKIRSHSEQITDTAENLELQTQMGAIVEDVLSLIHI